jgi:hypothetical protein
MIRYILICSGILFALLMAGCSNEPSPLGPDDTALTADDRGVVHAVLSGSDISSAHLNVSIGFPNGHSVNLHRVLNDWDPSTVNWTNFAGAFSPDIEGSFVAASNGWYEIGTDVTELVRSWADGEHGNFGILLEQSSTSFAPIMLFSSERPDLTPFLEICYTTPTGSLCDTVYPIADVFIDEAFPNRNFEGSGTLLIGQMMNPGEEKQALIRFDLPDTFSDFDPSAIGGCVWEDVNLNGIRDIDEQGLTGIVVSLYDCQEVLLLSADTDSSGGYTFNGLSSGSYLVEFAAPAGYLFSPGDQGTDDAVDSDVDPATGRTVCFELGEGVEALSWCAGLISRVDDDPGCTYSKGYWKNHAGFGPQDDEVSSLLPIWLGDASGSNSLLVDNATIAVEVLSHKTCDKSSNGLTKLYAQLLAAKLNIANGASDFDIADVIAQADGFLASHSCADWVSLDEEERKTVLDWMGTLGNYNNGDIGPGHCEDEPSILNTFR